MEGTFVYNPCPNSDWHFKICKMLIEEYFKNEHKNDYLKNRENRTKKQKYILKMVLPYDHNQGK